VSNANPSMFAVTQRWGSCLTASLRIALRHFWTARDVKNALPDGR